MKSVRTTKMASALLLAGFTCLFFACTKDEEEIIPEETAVSGRVENNGYERDHDYYGGASREKSTVVLDWYKLQMRIVVNADPALSPVLLCRAFGYIGAGLYESVQPGIYHGKSLDELLYEMPDMPGTDSYERYEWPVAANAALAKLIGYFLPEALLMLNQESIDSLERVENYRMKQSTSWEVFRRSQNYGRSIADAIIAWSKTDEVNLGNTGYVVPEFPGAWEPTPPAYAAPASPFYGTSRPFLVQNKNKVTDPLPFRFNTHNYSRFYAMAKAVYDVSGTMSAYDANTALYWNDGGVGLATPPGHNISILTQVLEKEGANLATAAIAYAKTGIAMHDAVLVCWRSKYLFNVIRPITYINAYIDPSWTPLIVTPPHPEYPSGHSMITGSFMQVMTSLFGNHYSFTDNTYSTRFGGARTYSSFNDAADECAQSRFYGGIHYQNAIQEGIRVGRRIGQSVGQLDLTY